MICRTYEDLQTVRANSGTAERICKPAHSTTLSVRHGQQQKSTPKDSLSQTFSKPRLIESHHPLSRVADFRSSVSWNQEANKTAGIRTSSDKAKRKTYHEQTRNRSLRYLRSNSVYRLQLNRWLIYR